MVYLPVFVYTARVVMALLICWLPLLSTGFLRLSNLLRSLFSLRLPSLFWALPLQRRNVVQIARARLLLMSLSTCVFACARLYTYICSPRAYSAQLSF